MLLYMQRRAEVNSVRDKLASGLRAVAGAALGNSNLTAARLGEFSGLVTPLLASPLVGEGAAFDATLALAASLPKPLAAARVAVAAALRLVSLHNSGA